MALLAATQGGDGESVLGLPAEAVVLGTVLGVGTHQTAPLVSVLQAVQKHMIQHLAMTQVGNQPGL